VTRPRPSPSCTRHRLERALRTHRVFVLRDAATQTATAANYTVIKMSFYIHIMHIQLQSYNSISMYIYIIQSYTHSIVWWSMAHTIHRAKSACIL